MRLQFPFSQKFQLDECHWKTKALISLPLKQFPFSEMPIKWMLMKGDSINELTISLFSELSIRWMTMKDKGVNEFTFKKISYLKDVNYMLMIEA